MQFKRLKDFIEGKTKKELKTIGVKRVEDRDHFYKIGFTFKNVYYEVCYDLDKRNYSFLEGRDEHHKTIMSSNRTYKQIKETLSVILS